MSDFAYYDMYFEFAIYARFSPQFYSFFLFMTSLYRLPAKCLRIHEPWYVAYVLVFASVLMLALACRMKLYKMVTQNQRYTCEVCHSQNQKSLGANDGVFLGIDLRSLQPLNTTIRFGRCLEHWGNHYIRFGRYMCILSIYDSFWLICNFMTSTA